MGNSNIDTIGQAIWLLNNRNKKLSIDNIEWRPHFAWLPVTTISNERIWLKKIYKRERYAPVNKIKIFTASNGGKTTVSRSSLNKVIEYGTLFDTLAHPEPPESTDNIIIPMIRRVMPNIIASSIVNVQPMTGPIGNVFTVKPKYTPQSRWYNSNVNGFYSNANYS